MDTKEIARLLGAKGGQKTRELYGTNHYREAQKKGVEARKRRKKLSTDKI